MTTQPPHPDRNKQPPPDHTPTPSTGPSRSSTPAPTPTPDPAPTPPPGSQGYRRASDPLPRGIPLSDGTRAGTPARRPLSYGPGGAASDTTPPPSSQPRPEQPAGTLRPHSSSAATSDTSAPASLGAASAAAAAHRAATPPSPKPLASTNTTASITDSPKAAHRPAAAPAHSHDAASSTPPPAAPADGRDTPGSSPPPPPASKDHRKLLLAFMLLLSLAAHATLAWKLYDLPLGSVDPNLIRQTQPQFYRVQSLPDDMVIPDDRATLIPAGNSQRRPASPLTDLSAAMLQGAQQPQVDTLHPDANAGSTRPNPQPFEDTRPAVETPARVSLDMPQSIQSHMQLDIPLSTRYVAPATTPASPQGTGRGNNAGSSRAAALLDQTIGLPQGTGHGGTGTASGRPVATAQPQLPQLPAPRLTDRADILEQRPTPLDLAPGHTDLSSITNDAATALSVPEQLDNDFDYAVTRFIPKSGWGSSREDQRGYFRVDITARRSLRKLQTMPKDLVILIDTSGSVPQHWIDHTLRGVRDSLASLNPGDRFNIVYFNDNPAVLGPEGVLPFNEENIAKAQAFLAQAKSGGMTDVNQALSRLLTRDVAADRSYEIILISDGRPTRGVMDTRELLNLITRDNDLAASIYCIGIGRAQNRTLLEFLAYRNKGFCVFVDDPFQASVAIRDLLSRLRYPIMKDVRLAVMGLNDQEIFPADLPTIHQGETFSIFGRFDDEGKPFTMRLTGHNGKQRYDFTFTRDIAQAETASDQLARDWGFWKLHHLYNQMLRQGDSRELRNAIEQLRRKYKLNTLYQQ